MTRKLLPLLNPSSPHSTEGDVRPCLPPPMQARCESGPCLSGVGKPGPAWLFIAQAAGAYLCDWARSSGTAGARGGSRPGGRGGKGEGVREVGDENRAASVRRKPPVARRHHQKRGGKNNTDLMG